MFFMLFMSFMLLCYVSCRLDILILKIEDENSLFGYQAV